MGVIVFLLYLLGKTRFDNRLKVSAFFEKAVLVHPPELGVNCWLLLLKASVTC